MCVNLPVGAFDLNVCIYAYAAQAWFEGIVQEILSIYMYLRIYVCVSICTRVRRCICIYCQYLYAPLWF